MANNQKIRLKPISAAISAALLMGTTQVVMAQDEDSMVMEEVVVTGIRRSMIDSMN